MSVEAVKIKEQDTSNSKELSQHDDDLHVPGLSNDNQHGSAPDWSVFSLKKFHPHLGLIQMALTVLGLLAGLAYAAMSLQAVDTASVTIAVFSFLSYGLIGLVGGYFSIWITGAAVALSPVILLASFFM
ncbi:MAG: hypothetical protein VYC19_07475 [Pseudomonadota bacterium]|nr:hypothetical protein [Alphaproteobacteria bacterium]MEC7702580.1 hypothetical protein [Pseudomonadota bacterium]MEC9236542.1 hypothetical protein [Pseudomonadota bacterium]MEE3323421.1 hypothetical protein [Pseudomonadota bacterium]